MQYISLVRLSPEGLDLVNANPREPLIAEQTIGVAGVTPLGIYAVLGHYDYVAIIEAPDNDAVARWSVEFGARIRAEITTMPAVPISHMERPSGGTVDDQASEPLPGYSSSGRV